jgi:MoxR-like ATPase
MSQGATYCIDEFIDGLERCGYIADRPLATIIYLAQVMEKPLFLEGEPGVGKTEVAIVLAQLFNSKLIRLQCYEGLDASAALYEWNYPKQILRIRLEEKGDKSPNEIGEVIFGREYLIKRPLLEAIQNEDSSTSVLLIDELDRADEEFEAFLLEVLSDFQITIPEIGTVKATRRPFVVITSNRTREIHDALKRRCLYHWIDFPSFEKELKILMAKVPGIGDVLAKQVCYFMERLREEDLIKHPGISETIDWASALMILNRELLDEETVMETLGCIFKHHEDLERFQQEVWSSEDKKRAYLIESPFPSSQ